MQPLLLSTLVAAALALTGCSSQQLYAAGQGWQRNECNRLPDRADRERCAADAERTYDAWQRERRDAQAAR